MSATPALLGLMAALAWACHDFMGRFSSRAIGQTNTTFGVMLAGMIALTLILAAGEDLPGLALDETMTLPIAAGIAYAAATLLLFTGYRIGSLSIVSPLAGSYPALNVAWNFAMGSRPSLYAWAGMAAVMAGTLLVSMVTADHEKTGHIERGSSLAVVGVSLAAALCFSLAVGTGQLAAADHGEFEATWFARIAAVATVAVVLLAPRLRSRAPVRWWPVVAVMGLLDTTAMLAVFKAGQLPAAEIATVTASSFGGVVGLLGWLFLREPVGTVHWLGIAFIVAGVATLTTLG